MHALSRLSLCGTVRDGHEPIYLILSILSIHLSIHPSNLSIYQNLSIYLSISQCAVSSQPPTIITHMFSMGD